MPLPELDSQGNLPPGVHEANLAELSVRFGVGSPQRQKVTANLLHVYRLVQGTDQLERFLIFGSYVSSKPDPNDVDIFLVMAEDFEVEDYTGETREVFSHGQAQARFGASVFWATRQTRPALLEEVLAAWQTTRDQRRRGIVEIKG